MSDSVLFWFLFEILISDDWLFLYRNTGDFCMLILNLVTFLMNYCYNSSAFLEANFNICALAGFNWLSPTHRLWIVMIVQLDFPTIAAPESTTGYFTLGIFYCAVLAAFAFL